MVRVHSKFYTLLNIFILKSDKFEKDIINLHTNTLNHRTKYSILSSTCIDFMYLSYWNCCSQYTLIETSSTRLILQYYDNKAQFNSSRSWIRLLPVQLTNHTFSEAMHNVLVDQLLHYNQPQLELLWSHDICTAN